jgi:ABC-2 type transport system ATP-binding protein
MIEANALTKRFGDTVAVSGLSFTVSPGEILGFLGPNGAGKSTTLRMIAGFTKASSGHASIGGHDVASAPLAARRQLGYLPEGAPAWPEMTPHGFLQCLARIRGLSPALARSRLHYTIERLQLDSVLHQRIDTLSKGFKRRVGLAQALLHDPPVLILDEPTDGLDPNQKHEVRSLIKEIAADKTILISTHLLDDVRLLCTRALIIHQGQLVTDATPQSLAARSRFHQAVTLQLHADLLEEDLELIIQLIHAVPGVKDIDIQTPSQTQGYQITAFPAQGQEIYAAIRELASQADWPTQDVRLELGRLDDVFRQITGNSQGQP